MEDLSPYLTTQFRGFPLTYQTRRVTRHSFLCEHWGLTPGTLGRHDPPIRKSAFAIRKPGFFSSATSQWEPYTNTTPGSGITRPGAPIKVPVGAVIAGLEPKFHHNFRVLQTETHTLKEKVEHLTNAIRDISSRLEQQEIPKEDSPDGTGNKEPVSKARDPATQLRHQATVRRAAQELEALKQQRAEEQLRVEQLEVGLELAKMRARSAALEAERVKQDSINNLPTPAAAEESSVASTNETRNAEDDLRSRTPELLKPPEPETKIRTPFLALRKTLSDFSTSSSLQLVPLSSGSEAFCTPDIWNSLTSQQRSHRVLAKMFEILWRDLLRPDVLSFGLDGIKLAHEDRTVSQPEKHLRTLEKELIQFGVPDPILQSWRRSVISTTAPLRNPNLSLAPTTSKIFSALSPVIQFVFARNAEQVKNQILRICKEAMKLKLLLRSEQGGWKIEMPPDGEVTWNGAKGPGPGKRLVLFGKLTRQGEDAKGSVVVESGWGAAASGPEDQAQAAREGSAFRPWRASPVEERREISGHHRMPQEQEGKKQGRTRIPIRAEPIPKPGVQKIQPPIKSLPEISRKRKEPHPAATSTSQEPAKSPVMSLPEIDRERKRLKALAKVKALEEEKTKRHEAREEEKEKLLEPGNMVQIEPPPATPSVKPLLHPTAELWAKLDEQRKSFAAMLLDLGQPHFQPEIKQEEITPTPPTPPPVETIPDRIELEMKLQRDILTNFTEPSITPQAVSVPLHNLVLEEKTIQSVKQPDSTRHPIHLHLNPQLNQTPLQVSDPHTWKQKRKRKRKRKTGDDPWGIRDWNLREYNLHERDPEDSNTSGEGSNTAAGSIIRTRSSTPGSGTVDAEGVSDAFGREGEREDEEEEKGKEGTPSVLAKVMRLFDDEG